GADLLGTGPVTTVTLPLGVHIVTLTVTSASGETDTDDVLVAVVDTTPPEMTFTLLTDTLWPPNGRMALVGEVRDVSDICDANPAVSATVSSNEPIDGPGDPDWELAPNGDVWEIWLRAERYGAGSAREYTINVVVTDWSGNQTTESAIVTVPHDRGRRPRQ
ncbi:MAG: hypothetical protein ACE5JM_11020, partial [Armatimonadota bacterium]